MNEAKLIDKLSVIKTTRKGTDMPNIEELKKKRDQLTAKIQAAEARKSAEERKLEARIKILVGSAFLEKAKRKGDKGESLLRSIDEFLTRPVDRKIFKDENGKPSDIFLTLTEPKEQTTPSPTPEYEHEAYQVEQADDSVS
ncbi:hypothetical protein [Stutzerimonas zhaodongensis]|uniref:hypothetical protein n=1 Tax=Stutzerimonas zhaodongensis TaxID=1176257 RepID=UPI0021063619|nr:hypothetical protein [Stutzerimonas zhaodongensis]MCQ2032242.1 hypothetical protein [Stutzerimonas zhaodongensis]